MANTVTVFLLPHVVEKLQPIAEAQGMTVTDLVMGKVYDMIEDVNPEQQTKERENVVKEKASLLFAFIYITVPIFGFLSVGSKGPTHQFMLAISMYALLLVLGDLIFRKKIEQYFLKKIFPQSTDE